MKDLKKSYYLALVVGWCLLAFPLAIVTFTGCGTNAPTKAAQGEQILITAVNDGMTEWAAYVNAGKAKQSQIDLVKISYNSYYTAQQTAKAVIEKVISKDPTATVADVGTANQAVKDAENALLVLLNSFIIKK